MLSTKGKKWKCVKIIGDKTLRIKAKKGTFNKNRPC